jgi:hypothetical protein
MTSRAAAFFAATVMAVSALAATPYVGAQSCKPCHAAIFESQTASAHAGALSRVADHRNFPPSATFFRGPQYRFEIAPSEGGVRVRLDNGTDLMDLPLEWAFGAGRQGVTFVSRVNRVWYVEHYGTWYAATNSYGPTPGHAELHPKTINEAAGVLYSTADETSGIKGCFECHSTGPVTFAEDGDTRITESGVRCESCHGPGRDHAGNPAHRRLTNPAQLSSAQLNEFCGRCHRPPAAKGVTIDWNYAWNVRHQPVYLSRSVCFLKSHGALSCLTCHDPHEAAAKREVSFFNQKCLGCHAGSATTHTTACIAKNRSNCVDCHMPLVSPQPPLRFTNHWIGIYGEGARLKPISVAPPQP